MNSRYTIYIFIIALLGFHLKVKSQLSGKNLLQYQLGNFPDTEPRDLSVLYNQLDLQYRYHNLNASIQLEQFLTPYNERNYQQLNQYNITYNDNNYEFQVGNIYKTLGRGLLFRSYEIPGSIIEDQVFRVQYGFFRDLEGVMGQYSNQYVNVVALRGKALDNEFDPTQPASQRRKDLVEAVETNVSLYNQQLGGVFMRNNHDNPLDYASLYLSGYLPLGFNYHAEIAQQLDNNILFKFNESANYGIYGSIGFSRGNLGVSLEYKDYQNFLIGGGINNPPALIKEHAYIVLNRSIHEPELSSEKGFQSEWYYNFSPFQTLTLNYTYNENKFRKTFVYQEYFAEFTAPINEKTDVRLFADYANDDLKFHKNRISGGIKIDYLIKGRWGSNLQLESQRFIYTLSEQNSEAFNHAAIGGIYYGSKFSTSFVFEHSTAPNVIRENENFKYWFGANATYKPNFKHTINLFIGNRRGGPACTSGICYEVPDFSGFEIRVQSRL